MGCIMYAHECLTVEVVAESGPWRGVPYKPPGHSLPPSPCPGWQGLSQSEQGQGAEPARQCCEGRPRPGRQSLGGVHTCSSPAQGQGDLGVS